jgi:hypothetical protein
VNSEKENSTLVGAIRLERKQKYVLHNSATCKEQPNLSYRPHDCGLPMEYWKLKRSKLNN